MKPSFATRVPGIFLYLAALLSLQQVIIIPLMALTLIVLIYRAKTTLYQNHAKFMLAIFASISGVMLIINYVFATEEKLFAASVCVALGALFLLIGAVRMGMGKGALSNLAPQN